MPLLSWALLAIAFIANNITKKILRVFIFLGLRFLLCSNHGFRIPVSPAPEGQDKSCL
jgi:hypothetical protein